MMISWSRLQFVLSLSVTAILLASRPEFCDGFSQLVQSLHLSHRHRRAYDHHLSEPRDRPHTLAHIGQKQLSVLPATTVGTAGGSPNHKSRTRIPVIQYHDDWVCVNKPAGMSTHRGTNTKRSETTLRSLVKRQLARKVFPVHRLDHRTSGAILFAFDSATCNELHGSLKNSTKEYVALLRGEWQFEERSITVDQPLKVAGVEKEATTIFTLLATQVASNDGSTKACSLVLCRPITGRTHQIRRHAWRLGQPILGDSQHGNSKVNRWWRQEKGLDRLALHCLSLQVLDSEPCTAGLPIDLRRVLEEEGELWRLAVEREPRLLDQPTDKRGGTFGRHYRKRLAIQAEDAR